jgi:hypothetical protein
LLSESILLEKGQISLIKKTIEAPISLPLKIGTLEWKQEVIGKFFDRPHAVLHPFRAYRRIDRTKEAEGLRQGRLVWPSTTMACIYNPEDAKIGFGKAIDSESVMETDQHSEDSGNSSCKIWNAIDSNLLLHITIDIMGLLQRDYIETDIRPTKSSLD